MSLFEINTKIKSFKIITFEQVGQREKENESEVSSSISGRSREGGIWKDGVSLIFSSSYTYFGYNSASPKNFLFKTMNMLAD